MDLVFVCSLLRQGHLRVLEDNGLTGRILGLILFVLATGVRRGGHVRPLFAKRICEGWGSGGDSNGRGGGSTWGLNWNLQLCKKANN